MFWERLFCFLFVFYFLCERFVKIENSEQAFDYIKSLKNYISDVKITFKNDRGEGSFYLKQYSNVDSIYRMDLEGDRSYIYKDDKIHVKDIKNTTEYSVDEKFDEVYKYCFLNEYIKLIYSMDEVIYFKESIYEGENEKVIYGARVNIPTNNLNIKYAILYLDGEKHIPIKLEIFDSKNNERVLIEYITFEILQEIDNNVFNH